ncbi:hypothetical protein MTBBW1_220015 [Desulfamplus magnetovallimortis]|uniref:Uncharacterized protein n=1 Tax=Desulfamplus magnetovallimortis TaxID=1246637 RepID=A0A1W1HD15_9BACT|nr:hypothetical protein [Desulfamplus magnetovallimortis]SLM30323.1 hypothetical protein MTBBW1_220015 [Desulfamplus magnetovallimortis]
MANPKRKIIGYFAFVPPNQVVCTGDRGDACVISASSRTMKAFVKEIDPDDFTKRIIKKTSFEEILNGLKLGAAYAFDQDSYKKFYPLARKEGLQVAEANFEEMKSKGFRFFTVQLKSL